MGSQPVEPGWRCHPTPSHPAASRGEGGRSNDLAGGARGGVGGVRKQRDRGKISKTMMIMKRTKTMELAGEQGLAAGGRCSSRAAEPVGHKDVFKEFFEMNGFTN